jgi:Zn-dependent protease
MDFAKILSQLPIFYVPFLFALCFHEFAHAWMAKKRGDQTAEFMGRLTMNPMAHADIIGTVVLPIGGFLLSASGVHLPILFGWAKPVPVNPLRFKDQRKDMFWVAAAGPLSNILLAFVAAFAWALLSSQGLLARGDFAYSMLSHFILINLVLAFFNLLPVHPLDGGKILARFLPEKVNRTLESNQQMTFLVLMLFMLSGSFRLLWPLIEGTANGMINLFRLVL